MALDQIWKQQLTLVTYGNEYLSQGISFNHWIKHQVFNQHCFQFRDLMNQHLLAQHFQIWLEGLKKQGVQRISLHSSIILNEEQNPNPNVELLPIAHFIVSHEPHHKKVAWIFGKELAEWYSADNDYEAPQMQQDQIRHETFWRFDINAKLSKRIEADLKQPNWDDIHLYTDNELFDNKLSQNFIEPTYLDSPYYGSKLDESILNTTDSSNRPLSLLPTGYTSDFAHKTLYRLDALSDYIQHKIQHPYDQDENILSPEEQLDLRHFSQKIDDLYAKFIVKVANHYQTAQLTPKMIDSPFENTKIEQHQRFPSKSTDNHKHGKTSVLALIVITIFICLAAYYFGL